MHKKMRPEILLLDQDHHRHRRGEDVLHRDGETQSGQFCMEARSCSRTFVSHEFDSQPGISKSVDSFDTPGDCDTITFRRGLGEDTRDVAQYSFNWDPLKIRHL